MHVCACMRIRVRVRLRVRVRECARFCMCVRVCACVYACMCVCECARIHLRMYAKIVSTFESSLKTQQSTYSSVNVEIKCTTPPEVSNTLLDIGGTRKNEYAHYACIDGFRLEGGNVTKRCNNEAKWEGKNPLCVGGFWTGN